jgi:hypothetical protein
MSRQGFDSESFSGVRTSEQKVDAQFFGGDRIPVRRFAGNESVDSFRRARASLPILGRSHRRTKNRVRRFGKAKTLQGKQCGGVRTIISKRDSCHRDQ